MTDETRRAEWVTAFDAWLREVGRKSRGTARLYETAWRRFYEAAPVSPWLVDRADVVRFAEALQTSGYRAGTVNAYLSAVSGFYAYIVDVHQPQLATRNPARGVDWLDTDDTPSAWISKAEVDKLLASIPADGVLALRDLALLETLWRTAMRNSAVRLMRLTDFRRQGREIWLRYKSKGKEGNRVFPDAAWQRVKAYLTARGRWDTLAAHLDGAVVETDWYVFIGHASNAHLWGDGERRPMTLNSLTHMVQARTRAVLGTAYKPHSFRHGRAHYLDEQGVKVQDISRFLDHASVDHTMRYLQSMEDESGALGNL